MTTDTRSLSTRVRLRGNVTHDISVVIVSYNTREMTLACVRSIFEHSDEFAVEIIVVDNQSSDGSGSALRAEFPEITVIDSPTNGGFAFGNTIGVEQASGRHILLLNPDAEIYAETLPAAMRHMSESPMTGIMGSRVWLDDGTQQSSMMRFLTLRQFAYNLVVSNTLQRKIPMLGDTRYASLPKDLAHKVDSVSGCFMFVRREVFEAIGGLDTRFFMYGEEIEWCHRAKRAGWDVVYNPDAEILHHGAASTAHMSEWKAVEMTRGQILFFRLTRGSLVAWLAAILMALRDFIRAPYYGILALLNGLRVTENTKPWWARFKYLLSALVALPRGQSVDLPDPENVQR